MTSDSNIPRYGLIKIHKADNLLRIITSSINSPLFFLHNIIIKSISQAPSYIKDSFYLVEKLNGKAFDSNYVLASLDVVSLFNVPVDLALNSIEKRSVHIFTKTNISKRNLLRL